MSNMVDIYAIKAAVKLTLTRMDSSCQYCRCCYTFEMGKTLYGPELDVYKLICNPQFFGSGNTSIIACIRCREFLKEIDDFRIAGDSGVETSCTDLSVKSHKIEMMLREVINDNSSVKIEPMDYNGGNIQINNVEVDFEPDLENRPETSQEDDSSEEKDTRKADTVNEIEVNFENSNEKLFSCDQCNYSGKSKRNLTLHKRRHSDLGEKSFKCSECSYESRTMGDLKCHAARKHSDEKPFSCDQCNYTGKTKKNLFIHKKIHASKCDTFYKCTECSYKSKFKTYLKRHSAYKHSDEKPFPCDQCNYSAKSRSNLIVHKKNHLSESDRPYECSICSYRAKSIPSLKRHAISKHTDEKPFACDRCSYRCKFKDKLVAHQKAHVENRDKPFKCNECSYESTNMFNLKCHVASKHSDEKPFSCDQCDYRGKTKHCLNVHIRRHVDNCDKPYKCEECDFRTATMYQLRNHIAYKHSDEKPFPCDQCSYSAKTKNDLTIHKKNHLDDCDKPYKCSECSYATTTMVILRRHTAYKHSNERPFTCDQCSYSSKSKKNLTVHKKKHSNGSDDRFECS